MFLFFTPSKYPNSQGIHMDFCVFLDKTKKPASSEIFLKIIETGKVTPVNENYQKINDILNTGLEPLFLGKEKARDLLNSGLLIDLSRYAY